MAEPAHVAHGSDASGWGVGSVLMIVLAGVLIGVALTGIAYWLLTFQWLYMLSFAPLAIGGYLLFTRSTGADHA